MSEQRTLAQKLLSVQKNIGAVTKSARNTFFKDRAGNPSKYADLNEVLDVAKAALNQEGIFVVQGGDSDASGGIFLRTALVDADTGQMMEGKVYLGQPTDMQKMGAAITYARRFGLTSLLALESEDDDGETAVGRGRSSTNIASSTVQPTAGNGEGKRAVHTAHSGITIQAPKVADPAKPPGGKAVSEGSAKEETAVEKADIYLKKISLTSKVLIDSKRATQEQVVGMLKAFGVTAKEQLNGFQARELLKQLEEILNK